MSRQRMVIGIGGHAVALDVATGEEIWRTKLKGRDSVTVSCSGADVHAGTGGELFCLDATTGTIRWRAKLKGLGLGLVTFPGSDGAAGAARIQAQRAAAGAAAS